MAVREEVVRNNTGYCWQHVRVSVAFPRETKGSDASAIQIYIYNSDLKHGGC